MEAYFKRIVAVIMAAYLSSCVQYITEEVQTEPIASVVIEQEPIELEPYIKEDILLKPLPIYPAYIKDQCSILWGIPASTQGVSHKEKINVTDIDGNIIPSCTLSIFTLSGSIYLTHIYTVQPDAVEGEDVPSAIEYTDYYKQTGDVIELVKTIPDTPKKKRATLDGIDWKIETSVVCGDTRSYLYCMDVDVIAIQGSYLGKGALGGWREAFWEYAILDNGILVMADEGAIFMNKRDMGFNPVSEPGELWKLQ